MRIRFWPAFAVAFVMAVTIALGFWQLGRARQKEARQQAITHFEQAAPQTVGRDTLPLASIEYHRVRASGRFMPERVVYLQNRPYDDQPGFYVVMPMQLANGGYVLVNRGWLPRASTDMNAIAPYKTPPGQVYIEGVARADASRAFQLGGADSAASGPIRQNLDVHAYAREIGLPLQPFVMFETSDTGDGLVRDWPPPTLGVERNYGYMVQWWSMALVALLFGLYAARQAARKAAGAGTTARSRVRQGPL
ncbi:MAG: SURF1 family protein [Janthinobacterium lividum]